MSQPKNNTPTLQSKDKPLNYREASIENYIAQIPITPDEEKHFRVACERFDCFTWRGYRVELRGVRDE